MTNGRPSATRPSRSASSRSRRLRLRRGAGAAPHRHDVNLHHEGEAEDDADDEAGGKKVGDRGPGEPAIDDEGDARRDEQRAFGARGDEAEGEPFRVARAHELGVQEPPERGDGRGRRPTHRAESHARDHRRVADAAAQMADVALDEIGEPLGDRPARHDVGREDEERDCEKRPTFDPAEELLRDHDRRHLREEQQPREHARDAHDQEHLEAEREQDRGEEAEEQRRAYVASRPRALLLMLRQHVPDGETVLHSEELEEVAQAQEREAERQRRVKADIEKPSVGLIWPLRQMKAAKSKLNLVRKQAEHETADIDRL